MTKTAQEELQEYEDHLNEMKGEFAKRIAMGEEVTAAECALVPYDNNNSANAKWRDHVVKVLKIKAGDYDRELKTRKVRDRFGMYPQTATDLVDQIAKELRLHVLYNGRIKQDAAPYMDRLLDEDVKKHFGSDRKSLADVADAPEFRMYIQNRFKNDLEYYVFQRKVRIEAAELGFPWHQATINDACDQWYDERKNNRLWRLFSEIDFPDSHAPRERGEAALRLIATTCFDDPEGPEFVIACLKKFIWQVKRKMAGLPIYDHLFVVLLGKTGSGKSTLLRKLLEPVHEVTIPTDFKAIADERIIAIWRNFIMFVDEMGWASKSNIDVIKNVITAPTVLRRPMRSNHAEEIKQNATFIGCANATDLSELIRDFTGTRRYTGLTTKDRMDWDVVNAIDPRDVWQCVDHEAADPTTAFRDRLLAKQEVERPKTNVEVWLDQLTVAQLLTGGNDKGRRTFPTGELYEKFRDYETRHFPGDATDVVWFGRRLAQAAKSSFEKARMYDGSRGWRYVADRPVSGAEITAIR